VKELSGGQLTWTDGRLYPLLHRLERNGLVEAFWGIQNQGANGVTTGLPRLNGLS